MPDANGNYTLAELNGMAQGAPTTDITDTSTGGSVWDSLFSNAGGIFNGVANIISSLNGGKTSYTAPNVYTGGTQSTTGGTVPPTTPPKSSNTWIWIVVALLVIGVIIFFIIKGGKK